VRSRHLRLRRHRAHIGRRGESFHLAAIPSVSPKSIAIRFHPTIPTSTAPSTCCCACQEGRAGRRWSIAASSSAMATPKCAKVETMSPTRFRRTRCRSWWASTTVLGVFTKCFWPRDRRPAFLQRLMARGGPRAAAPIRASSPVLFIDLPCSEAAIGRRRFFGEWRTVARFHLRGGCRRPLPEGAAACPPGSCRHCFITPATADRFTLNQVWRQLCAIEGRLRSSPCTARPGPRWKAPQADTNNRPAATWATIAIQLSDEGLRRTLEWYRHSSSNLTQRQPSGRRLFRMRGRNHNLCWRIPTTAAS